MTDLLAHGKRVLITSHTARALKVLRDKLPEELRHLCVSRTDDGVVGQQELETSVKGILARHGTYDAAFSAAEIKRLTDRLREARIRQADALLELRTVREMDTFVYSADIGDYTGTPAQIAERLRREEPEFGWIGEVPEPAADAVVATYRALAAGADRDFAHTVALPSGPGQIAAATAGFADAGLSSRRGSGPAEPSSAVPTRPPPS